MCSNSLDLCSYYELGQYREFIFFLADLFDDLQCIFTDIGIRVALQASIGYVSSCGLQWLIITPSQRTQASSVIEIAERLLDNSL